MACQNCRSHVWKCTKVRDSGPERDWSDSLRYHQIPDDLEPELRQLQEAADRYTTATQTELPAFKEFYALRAAQSYFSSLCAEASAASSKPGRRKKAKRNRDAIDTTSL